MCFCDSECAGTDISQKDEKQTKTDKNEHESGMSADNQRKSKLRLQSSKKTSEI